MAEPSRAEVQMIPPPLAIVKPQPAEQQNNIVPFERKAIETPLVQSGDEPKGELVQFATPSTESSNAQKDQVKAFEIKELLSKFDIPFDPAKLSTMGRAMYVDLRNGIDTNTGKPLTHAQFMSKFESLMGAVKNKANAEGQEKIDGFMQAVKAGEFTPHEFLEVVKKASQDPAYSKEEQKTIQEGAAILYAEKQKAEASLPVDQEKVETGFAKLFSVFKKIGLALLTLMGLGLWKSMGEMKQQQAAA